MSNTSVYDPALKRDFVDLPADLIIFFKQHAKYIPLPYRGETGIAVTYQAVVGKNAEDVPVEFSNTEALVETVEDYPFTNLDPQSKAEADGVAIHAMRSIFGKSAFSDVKKAYMINTSSVPIRLNFKENGKGSRRSLYVKRPDTNRLVGRFLYDIVSGIEPIRYGFNRGVFLEEEVQGSVLSRLDERVFLQQEDYLKGLVRAMVHSNFMGLASDVANPRNRIVDARQRTILFDFNVMFTERTEEGQNALLSHYLTKNFMTPDLFKVYLQEHQSVVRRVQQKQKLFNKFIRIAAELPDYSDRTLDERIKLFYGAKNTEHYFERKLDDYRLMSKDVKGRR